jgi:hypothetical protein
VDGTHLEVAVHHEMGGERQEVGREHGVEGREDVAVELFMQRHRKGGQRQVVMRSWPQH